MKNQLTTFSVLLGLTDFINPILWTVFFSMMLKHLKGKTDPLMLRVFKVGGFISLTGGYLIPTVKVLVGLGLFDFVMPVAIVHIVNTGFLISGVTLFMISQNRTYRDFSLRKKITLLLAYTAIFALICIISKYNTAAVLTGVAGIILIYISVMLMAKKAGKILPMVLAAVSLLLTVFLAVIGTKSDLYNASVHWVIELTNIVCQFLFCLAAKVLCDDNTDLPLKY